MSRPGVAATGAARDVFRSVQECHRQTAIGVTVEVDHIVDVLTRVAMHEEPRPSGTALLALLGITREPPALSRVADGKVEPIAEPNAESPIRPAFGPIVATGEVAPTQAPCVGARFQRSDRTNWRWPASARRSYAERDLPSRQLPGGRDWDCAAHASVTAAAARVIPPKKRNIVRGPTDEIGSRTMAVPDCSKLRSLKCSSEYAQ
jgi:hypothetical protein